MLKSIFSPWFFITGYVLFNGALSFTKYFKSLSTNSQLVTWICMSFKSGFWPGPSCSLIKYTHILLSTKPCLSFKPVHYLHHLMHPLPFTRGTLSVLYPNTVLLSSHFFLNLTTYIIYGYIVCMCTYFLFFFLPFVLSKAYQSSRALLVSLYPQHGAPALH